MRRAEQQGKSATRRRMACRGWLLAIVPWLGPQQQREAPDSCGFERGFASTDKRSSLVLVDYPGVEGWASYSPPKEIRIAWKRDFHDYLPETQSPPSLSHDGGFTSDQYVDVEYCPTEVCGLGANEMCVAGKTADDRTRIEIWRLSTAGRLGEPTRDESGRLRYPETTIPVESRTVIYDRVDPEKGSVRAILRNHGDGKRVWVLFQNSDNLFSMDLTTGATTVALTVAQQSHLSASPFDRWSANHSTGYMYALVSRMPSGDEGFLLLFDRDRNGTLDDSSFVVGSEWYTGAVDYSKFDDYLKRY